MTDLERRGDWLQTYSGKQFYPMDPRADDIDSADIAHALSLLCRFGGHVDSFYSVAEHCVLMSEHLDGDRDLALWALLHDATEAYVIDVPRPLKRYLSNYAQIETGVMLAVAERHELPREDIFSAEMPPEVKDADNRILLAERDALMTNRVTWWQDGKVDPLPVTVQGWAPAEAEERYLARLGELTA